MAAAAAAAAAAAHEGTAAAGVRDYGDVARGAPAGPPHGMCGTMAVAAGRLGGYGCSGRPVGWWLCQVGACHLHQALFLSII